jgi:hypothetical protein
MLIKKRSGSICFLLLLLEHERASIFIAWAQERNIKGMTSYDLIGNGMGWALYIVDNPQSGGSGPHNADSTLSGSDCSTALPLYNPYPKYLIAVAVEIKMRLSNKSFHSDNLVPLLFVSSLNNVVGMLSLSSLFSDTVCCISKFMKFSRL